MNNEHFVGMLSIVHIFPLEVRAHKHGIIMQYNILENNNILINTAHTVHW